MITAWRFAREGIGVVVLEAARIARGSTAASTALLMQEPDEDFHRLSVRYGAQATRRIWELSRQATDDFVHALRQLRIECGLVQRDSVYYPRTEADVATLRRECRLRRAAGLAARWLSRRALRRAANLDVAGAIRTRGNAQADPVRACVGFAGAAVAAGAVIFERSPVTSIARTRHGVRVRTAHGSIDASRVIVATGYATPSFKPLAGRFRMVQTYVIGTRRLTARERRRIGIGPVMLWDSGRPYFYARWTPDGRLLLGGGDRPRVSGAKRREAVPDGAARVREFFLERYPALAGIPFEYAWEGLFATTPDGLPYIGAHRRYPRHLFALGYGGNGMTFGYLAAELLLEAYCGRRSADHELFGFGRRRERERR